MKNEMTNYAILSRMATYHKAEPTEKRLPKITPVISSINVSSLTADSSDKPSAKAQAIAASSVKGPSVWSELLYLLTKLVVISLVFALIFTTLFGVMSYQDFSMNPAVKDGDLVIFFRLKEYGYLPGDAIVLRREGKAEVLRVVAVAGDTVDITEAGLSINGNLQQEYSIYQKTRPYAEGVRFPLTVPEGKVFVLGDSRDGATDSRVYGPVDIRDSLGKVTVLLRRRGI